MKKNIALLLVTLLVSSSLLIYPKTMSADDADNDYYYIDIYNDRDDTSQFNPL